MRRGTALLVGAAVVAAARLVPAGADTPSSAPDLPRALCSHGIVDPQGDAAPKYLAGSDTSAVAPDNPALDIRAVDLRLTATQLEVFMGVQGNPTTATMQPYEGAWRYEVTFSLGSKFFDYGLDRDNPADPGKELAPASSALFEPKASVTGVAQIKGSTGTFVGGTGNALSWIVLTSPRSEVEAAVGPITDGTDTFTGISGITSVETSNDPATADTTTATGAQAKYVAGDDWCFGPPPTSLSSLAVTPAIYHHSTSMSATLLDEDGKPVAGQPVNFTIQGPQPATATGTTDANGVATATFASVPVPAGTYPVTATFPGEGTTLKTSSVSGTLTVSAQKTVFGPLKVTKASTSTRTVTVALLDDLKKPVAGAKVDWYVNGKKITTATTDKTGTVVLRGVKPGQKIQAKYAGKPGYLLAAVSTIVKAS